MNVEYELICTMNVFLGPRRTRELRSPAGTLRVHLRPKGVHGRRRLLLQLRLEGLSRGVYGQHPRHGQGPLLRPLGGKGKGSRGVPKEVKREGVLL